MMCCQLREAKLAAPPPNCRRRPCRAPLHDWTPPRCPRCRMRKASTCPSGLDEELIAAALGVQAATATPTTYQGSPLSSESFDSQGMSSLGTTGRAQLTDSLTRRLFDAQADAATAHAQVQCLQEALLEVNTTPALFHPFLLLSCVLPLWTSPFLLFSIFLLLLCLLPLLPSLPLPSFSCFHSC